MSVYESILGHERQIAQLEKARRGDRVAHAYLFHGPGGVGKEKVAFAFAMALNCAEADAPCGRCDSCRRIQKGTHPDVRLLASEEDLQERLASYPAQGEAEREGSKRRAPSTQIRNEQIDELAPLLRHRPYLGRCKVVVVAGAERMNPNSQNRFLKTLEEPTSDSVIILVTAHPELLLPTVRSRCQGLAFGPVPRDQVARFLTENQGLDPARAKVVASMSQGSLRSAADLAAGEELERRDEVVRALSSVRAGDLEDLLAFSGEVGDGKESRETLRSLLGLWELWLRDLLLSGLKLPVGLLVNQDRGEELSRQAAEASPPSLLRIIEGIRCTRSALDANANPRLALEALLLSMRS